MHIALTIVTVVLAIMLLRAEAPVDVESVPISPVRAA
jgi:hypothetical protein